MLKRSSLIVELKKNHMLFLMLMPAVIYFIVFNYFPMAGIVIAFKNFQYDKGVFLSPWVGFNNFKFFFVSGKAWQLTRNTLLYNILFLASGLTIQLLVAIIFSELKNKLFKKVAHSVLFLPYFISWVVVASFVYAIFNYEFGSLNTFLRTLSYEPVDIYNTPSLWTFLLTGFFNWKNTGYGSVIFLAVITSISPDYYEAAEIDGAGIIKRIRYITMPMLKSTVIILILLQIGGLLRGNFDMFYQMIGTNSKLYPVADVIDTFVFRSLREAKDFGLIAAAGLYQQAVGFVIIMLVNTIVKKTNADYALF